MWVDRRREIRDVAGGRGRGGRATGESGARKMARGNHTLESMKNNCYCFSKLANISSKSEK